MKPIEFESGFYSKCSFQRRNLIPSFYGQENQSINIIYTKINSESIHIIIYQLIDK